MNILQQEFKSKWFCGKYCFDNIIVCLWVLTQAMTGTYSPSPSMDALSQSFCLSKNKWRRSMVINIPSPNDFWEFSCYIPLNLIVYRSIS